MTLTELLEKLKTETMENILEENEENMVECVNNEVYEDEDFYNYCDKNEWDFEKLENGKIALRDDITVFIDYCDYENRFDLECGNEIIIDFSSAEWVADNKREEK